MISAGSSSRPDLPATRFRFGECLLDVDRHVLERSGQAVAVEPRVFDLLQFLVSHAGELVSRDRLIDAVWQGRIVSDAAISACVAAARRAVGDDGTTQAVIRTVPRRGFTCVCDVEVIETVKGGPARVLPPRLQFTKTAEGKTLAFAVAGQGPAVLYTTFGGTSIEAQWNSPFFKPLFDAICAQNTLVRFDDVGCGQSDLDMDGWGLATQSEHMLRVADAAGLDTFGLFCQSGSALAAVHLAAHHPDRVSRLVLNGGYVQGRGVRPGTSGTEQMFGMIEEAWDKPDSSFMLAYSLLYFPEGPLDLAKDIVEIMHKACSAQNMLTIRATMNAASVADLLPKVACPTLVIHARNDSIHPLDQARQLAAGIPDAALLVLESANHVPMPGSQDWDGFVEAAVQFLNAG